MGARGGTAGAARAERAYERKHGEAAAFRASVLFGAGQGSSANDAQRAWNRERRTECYQGFRARAEEIEGGTFGNVRRKVGRWDSTFNALYRPARADGFSFRKGGPFQALLEYLGWTLTGNGEWYVRKFLYDHQCTAESLQAATMTSQRAGGVFSPA